MGGGRKEGDAYGNGKEGCLGFAEGISPGGIALSTTKIGREGTR